MTSHRAFLAGACALWLGTAGTALDARYDGRADAAVSQVAGTLILTFHVATSLPNGTSITIYPLVSPNDATYSDGTSTYVSATVSGGAASATIRIPYSWRVSSTSDQVSISVNVSGYGSTSTTSLSNSTYFTSTIALPANGTTKTVSYSGTL